MGSGPDRKSQTGSGVRSSYFWTDSSSKQNRRSMFSSGLTAHRRRSWNSSRSSSCSGTQACPVCPQTCTNIELKRRVVAGAAYRVRLPVQQLIVSDGKPAPETQMSVTQDEADASESAPARSGAYLFQVLLFLLERLNR